MFSMVLFFVADAVISDDSKDSFQLTKSSKKLQKRSYRRHQPSVGDSVETTKKESSREGRRERSSHDARHSKAREEKRRRHGEERYRDSRERTSRELLDNRDRYKKDSIRDHPSLSKHRDERFYDTNQRSHSPIQPPQQYEQHYDRSAVGGHKSRDQSRGRERVGPGEMRKRSKRYEEQQRSKERLVSRLQESGSDSEGEIRPPVTKKRPSDTKDMYIKSLIQDLDSHSSSESDSGSSAHTPKENDSSRSRSPLGTDDSNAAAPVKASPEVKAKTWQDIAEESSSGSESEQSAGSKKGEGDDLKFSQMSENYAKYSEMQSVSSSEMDEPEKGTPTIGSPKNTEAATTEEPMEQDKEMEKVSEGEEAKEEEVPVLPPYLPALMGCRSVESYEWLNRIEEGTYGVVFRGKDKRTGI